MLRIEELSVGDHIEIYYYNERDEVIKHLILDAFGQIAREYLFEDREDGQRQSINYFGVNPKEILGVRQYIFSESGDEQGWEEFKFINGRAIKLNSGKYEELIPEKEIKCFIYNEHDEPVGYRLYEHDKEYGMTCSGNFNLDGDRIIDFEVETFDGY